MTKIFLKTYYCLLFFILFKKASEVINEDFSLLKEYLMFARPLNWFSFDSWLPPMIYLFGLLFMFICIFKQNKYLQIITSLLFLMAVSFIYSQFGWLAHSLQFWLISSVLICFFSANQTFKSKANYFILRLIQAILLSHYFMAGLWKLRVLFSSKFHFSFQEIISEYIAYTIAEGSLIIHPLLQILLYQYPKLLSFGFICVLIFQISSLLPVFFNKFFIFYGILTCFFHLSTSLCLGLPFSYTMLAALFFLVLSESMMKKEEELLQATFD